MELRGQRSLQPAVPPLGDPSATPVSLHPGSPPPPRRHQGVYNRFAPIKGFITDLSPSRGLQPISPRPLTAHRPHTRGLSGLTPRGPTRPHSRDPPSPKPASQRPPTPPPSSPCQVQAPFPLPVPVSVPSLVVAGRHRAASVLTRSDRKEAPHFRRGEAGRGACREAVAKQP